MISDADELLNQSRESSLRSRCDSMSLVQRALEIDAEHSLAHATRGLYYYSERHRRNRGVVKECVTASARYLQASDAKAGHYCRALTAASSGDAASMVFHLEQQLLDDPLDINALKLCQSELFWLGEMQWSASISDSVEKHWDNSCRYYSDFLAIRAFDLEETGHYKAAEMCGRQAVEMNPSDVWGTHAVAHVMYMQGRSRDGADWLDSLHRGGHWQGLSQMVLHLWWHRALFHLLSGEHDAALAVYDDYLRNFEIDLIAALPDLYLDLQNATSLLLRLEFLNVDVGARWSALSEICAERINDDSNAFSCAHYVVVLAADERFAQAQSLIDCMSEASLNGSSLAAGFGNAAVPAAVAAVAHRKCDYRKVINTLMPLRYRMQQMGGSHAQREVFMLMLADALQREGEADLLQKLSLDLRETGFEDVMAQRIIR